MGGEVRTDYSIKPYAITRHMERVGAEMELQIQILARGGEEYFLPEQRFRERLRRKKLGDILFTRVIGPTTDIVPLGCVLVSVEATPSDLVQFWKKVKRVEKETKANAPRYSLLLRLAHSHQRIA